MSEFSECYHLKADCQQIVVDLIKESNNKGYVFPEKNGWVTFVLKGQALNMDEQIISLNPSVLIHYIYSEDHGWALRIFKKSEIEFEYSFMWTDDDEIHIEKNHFDLTLLNELIISQGNTIDGIESLFDINEDMFDLDEPPAYAIAQKLGLTYYEWMSDDYIDTIDTDETIIFVE
ncbi:hypothetical protein D3C76_102160 [compost metagenome]